MLTPQAFHSSEDLNSHFPQSRFKSLIMSSLKTQSQSALTFVEGQGILLTYGRTYVVHFIVSVKRHLKAKECRANLGGGVYTHELNIYEIPSELPRFVDIIRNSYKKLFLLLPAIKMENKGTSQTRSFR